MQARLAAQLLAGPPARSVEGAVARLLAVQAQDGRGFRLAVRARTARLTAGHVDRALTADRSTVVTWLNRGTLHLVCAEDYWWLHPLTTAALTTGTVRRLGQLGVSPDAADRGVAVIERTLAAHGPQTRGQLREDLAAAGVPVAGQTLVHLLALSSIRGLTVRGPVAGGEQAFVLVRDWLGPAPPPPDRDVALAELARRHLAGHGPAGDRDLARWSGLPLRDARRALTTAAAGLQERDDGLVELRGPHRAHRRAPPRLLGAVDPLLLGWACRDPIVGPHRGLVTVNGLFRPFALVAGRAVATWRMAGGEVVLTPFEQIEPPARDALDADAADVRRFLGR